MPTKKELAAREEAKKDLTEFLQKGETVFCLLRHVSKSGMRRVVDLFVIRNNRPSRISFSAALTMGWRYDRKHDGIVCDGAGMDMGFHCVYSLCQHIYGLTHGYSLKHEWI